MDIKKLQSKKIAIVGYGREGRALARFFEKNGIVFAVLDKDPKAVAGLPPAYERELGAEYLKNAGAYELLYRSPGVSRLDPWLLQAEKNGSVISSLTQIFFELCPCPIIGVTGTKGKGTVSSLIADILSRSGRKAFLGGNVGVTPLDFLPKLKKHSFVVLELSSFQLVDLKVSPRYACVLNFYPDHLDYHTDLEEYLAAKVNLIAHQKASDVAVLNADDETVRQLGLKSRARKFWFSHAREAKPGAFMVGDVLTLSDGAGRKRVCSSSELKLRGPHNLQNALAACAVSAALGLEISAIRSTLRFFPGLPDHRLEYAGTVDKVSFYNDSFATIPEATVAALNSFTEKKVLILGGSSKKLDYTGLARAVVLGDVRAVVLIGETIDEIKKCLQAQKYVGACLLGGKTMRKIVKTAHEAAFEYDVVLFSPAAASFDMFKNASERGDEFKQAVKAL